MSKDLGTINDYKARYLAKRFRDALNGKFTYEELYSFTRTIAPRSDAIQLEPGYIKLLQTIDKTTLSEYSKLHLGTVLHGKIREVNHEVRAEHDIICIQPGISPQGKILCATVTSQGQKYTDKYGELKEGMIKLHPGDIIQRKTNKTSLSLESYSGRETQHTAYRKELLVLLQNPTFQNYLIKPNKLRELLEALPPSKDIPRTIDRNGNPVYGTDTIVYPTTNRVGTNVKPYIYIDHNVDNTKTLDAIVNRLNRYSHLNPEDYMFRSIKEVNFKSLRDTDGTPEVTKHAFLAYVEEEYRGFKLLTKKLDTVLSFCAEYSYKLMHLDHPRNTILYIGQHIDKLQSKENVNQFLDYIDKSPDKILDLKLVNLPTIYR